MVLAAEYTVTTLVAWAVVALVVGFVAGWLLRPWLVADRLRHEYEDRLAALGRHHDETAAALEAVTAEQAATKHDLHELRAAHARAKADLGAVAARSGELEEQVATLATAKDAEIARLSGEASKVAGLEVSLADRDAQIADRDARVADRDAQLAERDGRIAELQARIAGLESQIAHPAVAAAPSSPVVPEPPGDEPLGRAAATQRVAEIAARTRGDAASVDDDLKRVHGIGPVIERMLKEMGITSFRQIARLTEEDVRHVATALDAFPDRIQRDDWMSSAAQLHEEKYGEPVGG